jgi:hypothetical protein
MNSLPADIACWVSKKMAESSRRQLEFSLFELVKALPHAQWSTALLHSNGIASYLNLTLHTIYQVGLGYQVNIVCLSNSPGPRDIIAVICW